MHRNRSVKSQSQEMKWENCVREKKRGGEVKEATQNITRNKHALPSPNVTTKKEIELNPNGTLLNKYYSSKY